MILSSSPAFSAHATSAFAQSRELADLHTHTTASDGILTPEQLVRKAVQRGLQVLSVTDHDTVDGVEEARTTAEMLGIAFVSGIEVSCYINQQEYHILGYGVNTSNDKLLAYTGYCREERVKRAERIVQKLQALHIPLTIEQAFAQGAGGVIGRQHIAVALHKHGFVHSTKEAFTRYLGNDSPAFEPKWYFSAQEAIALIKHAGGMAVIAHPCRVVSEEAMKTLLAAGLDGVEVVHPSHDPALQKFYERLAADHNLLMTGGSDYHGGRALDEAHFGKYGVPPSFIEQLLHAYTPNTWSDEAFE